MYSKTSVTQTPTARLLRMWRLILIIDGHLRNNRVSWYSFTCNPCLDTPGLVDFPPFLSREINFIFFCLLSCTPSPFWKGVYSKRKEFAPLWVKLFPFWVDPFSFLIERTPFRKGDKTFLTELPALICSYFVLLLAFPHTKSLLKRGLL